MRSYIYILILLLIPHIAYCQGSAYGYGQLLSLLANYKNHRESVLTFEKKLKGMTTVGGYTYAGTTNDKAKREVNTYYDMEIKKAGEKYALAIRDSNPETEKGELREAKSYRIYVQNINKIELRRKRDLDLIEQQYNSLIKVYSPYWSGNDRNGIQDF